MPARAELLFAYGTLMRGYALHPVVARGSTFLGEARVRGRLLDIGPYPGLVEGPRTVRGELYRIDDPELLAAIDREEGYNFERRRALVTLAAGGRRRAWLYRYTGSRARATPIPDGDYRRRVPCR